MRKILTVVSLLCIVASSASASAIQWTADKGGNGHWYEAFAVTGNNGISWQAAENQAQQMGGHLVTITSQVESDFVSKIVSDDIYWTPNILPDAPPIGPWIGGYQLPGSTEPDKGWCWVTGEEWSWTNWGGVGPDNHSGVENYINIWTTNRSELKWNDMGSPSWNGEVVKSYIVESDNSPIEAVPEANTVLSFSVPLIMFGLGKIRIQRNNTNK